MLSKFPCVSYGGHFDHFEYSVANDKCRIGVNRGLYWNMITGTTGILGYCHLSQRDWAALDDEVYL